MAQAVLKHSVAPVVSITVTKDGDTIGDRHFSVPEGDTITLRFTCRISDALTDDDGTPSIWVYREDGTSYGATITRMSQGVYDVSFVTTDEQGMNWCRFDFDADPVDASVVVPFYIFHSADDAIAPGTYS